MGGLLDATLRALQGPGPILAVQRFFGDSPLWRQLFTRLTYLGDAQAAIVVILLLLWLKGRRQSYGIMAVVALGALLDLALWRLLGLPRPNDPRIEVREVLTVSSFPSGHTMTATLLWGSLATFGELPWPAAAALVCLVMIARLYLGVHYLRDLLGALAIALALLALFHRLLWPRLARWGARRSSGFYLGLGAFACLGALVAIPFAPNQRPEIPAFVAGMALGLPLEYRFVRFTPARVSLAWQGFKVVVGLGLLALLAFGARRIGGETGTPALRAALTATAALWGVLGAPALFARLGLSPGARLASSPDAETRISPGVMRLRRRWR